MDSGKSTHAIQARDNYQNRNQVVLLMKPAIDTKGNMTIESRIGLSVTVDYAYSKEDDLFDFINSYCELRKKVNVVIIDEVQFSEPEQIDQLMRVTTDLNIPVICYGLKLDFQSRGFPGSTRLLEIAHETEEIKTMCDCGRKATYNARIDGRTGQFTLSGEQVKIDSSIFDTEEKKEETKPDRYIAFCPACYYKHVGCFGDVMNVLYGKNRNRPKQLSKLRDEAKK